MRANALRALAPALLVLGLVAFVAIASTGSRATGSDETRKPADALLDIFFSLALVALIPAAAILMWGLLQRKEIAEGFASGRFRRTGLLTFLVVAAALGAFGYWRRRDPRLPTSEQFEDVIVPRELPTTPTGEDELPSTYEAEFAWIPVLVVVVLVALGLAAAHVSARRRRARWRDEDATAGAIIAVLEDTLDDLRRELDPRKAVIAAYARLERTLAAHGLPRKAAETPQEYLARILPRLAVDRRSIRRLTDLFTRAKFSQHVVDAGMKNDAIEALAQVRDELRAAAPETPQEATTPAPLRTWEERA